MVGTRNFNAGLLAVGMLAFILNGVTQSTYGPALPVYLRQFGIGQGTASMLISAHWAGALGGALATMALPRLTGLHGLVLLGLGCAVLAWQAAWPVMLAGALLEGLGYGLIAAVYNRRYLTEFGDRGPAMVGVINAIFGIGAIGAPLAFVAAGNDPRWVFAGAALAAFATAIFAQPAPGQRAAMPILEKFRFRPEMALAVLTISCEATNFGLGPSGLVARGSDETSAAKLSSAFFVAFLLSRAALYWVAPRMRPYPLLLSAQAGVFVTSLAAHFVAPGPIYVLSGLFTGVLFPSLFVVASNAIGSTQRATSSIIASCLTGGIFGPLAVGAVLSRLGMDAFFAVMAGLVALVGMVTLTMARRAA